MKTSNEPPIDETFVKQVEATIRQLRRLSDVRPEAWRELDLTMTQYRALLFIRARQPLSVSEVGKALAMRLGAASALVNRLADFALVTRRENPADRRQTLVELAPAGEAMLARLEDDGMARARRMFARMSPRGREAWLIALEEAVRALAEDDETT